MKTNQQKKVWTPFLVVSDQLCVEDEKEYKTVNSESLKGKKKDIQNDISMETRETKNV